MSHSAALSLQRSCVEHRGSAKDSREVGRPSKWFKTRSISTVSASGHAFDISRVIKNVATQKERVFSEFRSPLTNFDTGLIAHEEPPDYHPPPVPSCPPENSPLRWPVRLALFVRAWQWRLQLKSTPRRRRVGFCCGSLLIPIYYIQSTQVSSTFCHMRSYVSSSFRNAFAGHSCRTHLMRFRQSERTRPPHFL